MAKKKARVKGKKLVIVESPTKARTLKKFLGREYAVESCMGHIRDLPQSAKDIPEKYKKEKWGNLGVNVDSNFEPVYCIPKNKTKIVRSLKDKLKDASELILATDEDREGESISWHLTEVLKPKVPVKRMVFHEITREAIEAALHQFREIDEDLVRAQEARRILDRLVGYTLSPLLWKKIAYGLSAGRVQSVAMRLIVEREQERARFKSAKYWSLLGQCEKASKVFDSRILSYEGKRIATGKDFDANTGQLLAEKADQVLHIGDEKALSLAQELKGEDWVVSEVEEKPISRKPAPPFITSTLQQEANRKLGMGSSETMQVAQKLYEQGFISYMRTDSTFLSDQAVKAARDCIEKKYGKECLPPEPRTYAKKKVKGAQEAHEAIRPSGTEFVTPNETGLKAKELKLYELIWKRTVASQMVNAQQKQVSVKFSVGNAIFNSTGMTIEFPGFLRAYVEGRDETELEDKEINLPSLKKGDKVSCKQLGTTEHETKPPARFTEASLVQTMEKEGIGRPSTYAVIINTIMHRGYVRKQGNALVPSFTAMAVSKLLSRFLPQYVDLGFTSEMERTLDSIAEGERDSVGYLRDIYFGDEGLKSQVEDREKTIDAEEARSIDLQGVLNLDFRVGRYGAYVCKNKGSEKEICVSLPETQAPADVNEEVVDRLIEQKLRGTDALGKHPESGLPVYVLSGKYGPYVQLGEVDSDKAKPKRTAIPPVVDPDDITLEQALYLLELPKTVGQHPDTGLDVKVGMGRFGPFVVHDGDFRSIPKTESLFDVDLNKALEIYSQPKRRRGRASVLKDLGKHPKSGDEISLMTGKYGPYIKIANKNIALDPDTKTEDVTLEMAVELINEKGALKKAKKKRKKRKKKATKKTVTSDKEKSNTSVET